MRMATWCWGGRLLAGTQPDDGHAVAPVTLTESARVTVGLVWRAAPAGIGAVANPFIAWGPQ